MQSSTRKTGLDIVRCVALIFIIGVHFFYHNGFYYQKQSGITMFVADIVRWITFTCVPMFIILTGYLKAKKELNMEHYKGVVPVIVTWIVVSIICIIFKEAYLGQGKSFPDILLDFVQFRGADYSWYIELYIGLFLLIPFLNVMFGWERERRYHNVLIVTMLVTVFVPNCINYVAGDIIPNYFTGIWPIAYYFFGCYIRKYQPAINKWVCVLLVVAFGIIRTARTFFSAGGKGFYEGIGGGYSDLYVAILTVLMFLLCYNVEVKSKIVSGVLAHVSRLSLHIYLISSISDALFNQVIVGYNGPQLYWWTFPVRVVVVFVLSLAFSELVYPISARLGTAVIDTFFKEKDSEGEDLLL